jgi:hypothetical protein
VHGVSFHFRGQGLGNHFSIPLAPIGLLRS